MVLRERKRNKAANTAASGCAVWQWQEFQHEKNSYIFRPMEALTNMMTLLTYAVTKTRLIKAVGTPDAGGITGAQKENPLKACFNVYCT